MSWIGTELLSPITAESGSILVTEQTIPVPVPPLQFIVPSYLYQQYSDDLDLQAFVDSYNILAQSYLDWFNQHPLAVYTDANISGALLDWIGQGIYGVPRPVFSTLATVHTFASLNSVPLNTIALDGSGHQSIGTAVLANDDYYKRTLTWFNFLGNGRRTNLMLLRWKIARFLYGQNGADVPLDKAQNIDIAVNTSPVSLTITIPAGTSSSYFQQAFNAGTLPFPFQLSVTVNIA